MACLKQNKDSLSDKCKQSAAQASRMAAGGAQNAAPAAPSTGSSTSPGAAADAPIAAPAAAAQSATATNGSSAKTTGTSTAGVGGSYLVLKKVQITGPGPDSAHPTMPAYDLLIPSTWKIQGSVVFGGSATGCFSDIYGIHLKASSPDDATFFSAGPDFSWQYADDLSVLKNLNDPNMRQLGVGGKPCPVDKPMKAEDFIRQNILKLYPSGTTVVSVSPFPELNQIVRQRLGLPSGNGNTGATRTDAVRVRLAFQRDGKDLEDWLAVAVVVNIYSAGRGSFYDSHATSLVEFVAPKGKLDANDKLFRVMVSSIQPEPQWVKFSGGVVAKLYQAQAQKVATINQALSQFDMHAAQVINGVTANAISGANVSAFHADQDVRGVRTFRDPVTGKTQELSNQYGQAWQNGAGDYIMSDDPNFNPNEHVSGNWSEMQPVR